MNITLIALISITIIFSVAIVLLIVLRNNDDSDNDKEKKIIWKELPSNEVHENVDCKNNEKDMDIKFSENLWNTPKRGDSRWKEGFQDMSVLV